MADEQYHKLFPDEFEEAEAEAAGAMVGWLSGKEGVGPQWTEAFREAFGHAVTLAFNAGVRAGRIEIARETSE